MSIGKVQIDIEEFLFETAEPCLDDKTGNAWLKSFRDTLQYKGRKANPLPFGIDCIIEAEGFNAQQAVKRMSGVVKGELVKSGIEKPTPAQIENALTYKYGAEYITYKNAIRAKEQVLLRRERIKQRNIEESLGITAGAPTREDGEFKPDSGNAGNIESATPAVVSREPEVLNLAYSGEFGNVRLTQTQYNALLQKFGNKVACDRAIDSMSAKLENGELEAKSHYATLVKWAAYRADKVDELKDAPHYETVSEHNARVLANGKKWIDEHFPKKEVSNG